MRSQRPVFEKRLREMGFSTPRKYFLLRAGWTLADMAEEVGVSRSTVGRRYAEFSKGEKTCRASK